MKYIFTCILFISFIYTGYCQTTFDNVFRFGDYFSRASIIIPDTIEQRFYIIGEYADDDPFCTLGYQFSAIDLDGNLLYNKKYDTPCDGGLYDIRNQKKAILIDNYIYISLTKGKQVEFMIFDKQNGNQIYKKNITNPLLDYEAIHNTTSISETKFACLSMIIEDDPDGMQSWAGQVATIDLESDSIVYFTLGIPAYNDRYTEIEAVTNGFIIGGDVTDFERKDKDYEWQASILKLDDEGNQLWAQYSGLHQLRGQVNDIYVEEDEESVVYVNALGLEGKYDVNGYSLMYWRPYITKINENHQIEWDTPVGPDMHNEYSYLSSIVKSAEGDGYVAAGQINNWDFREPKNEQGTNSEGEYRQVVALLAKVSKNGDSLWYRTYKATDGNGSRPFIYSMEKSPDNNGYIIGGSKWNHTLVDTFTLVYSWLLKVDNYGCLVPGCQDTVGVANTLLDGELDIRIYPNPTTDHLYIYQAVQGNIQYEVYDIMGKKITSFTTDMQGQTMIYNTTDLLPGNYFLKARNSAQKMSVLPFVKL